MSSILLRAYRYVCEVNQKCESMAGQLRSRESRLQTLAQQNVDLNEKWAKLRVEFGLLEEKVRKSDEDTEIAARKWADANLLAKGCSASPRRAYFAKRTY